MCGPITDERPDKMLGGCDVSLWPPALRRQCCVSAPRPQWLATWDVRSVLQGSELWRPGALSVCFCPGPVCYIDRIDQLTELELTWGAIAKGQLMEGPAHVGPSEPKNRHLGQTRHC